MLLTRATLDVLLKPRQPMTCRAPEFPTIILTESECKTFKFFQTPHFFVVVFPATRTMHCAIYKHTFSNFVGANIQLDVGGEQVSFRCGEEAFKAACAMIHLDLPDISSNENNLQVLETILNADEPKVAKKAGSKIKGFKQDAWNAMSFNVMRSIQMLKFGDPKFRDFALGLAQIAKDNDILIENCFFMEATSDDDLWGTGVSIDDVFSQTCKDGVATFKGRNLLGKAISEAFVALVSDNYVGLDETMDEFVARVSSKGGFTLFELEGEPSAKRAKLAAD